MKLFDRFTGASLKPSWEFKTDGLVWRLVPAPGGLLLGEERDIERKSVSFFALDQTTGSPLWQKVTFNEQQWWIGIEAVCDGVVLLHTFASPDLPGHRGITAVDIRLGQALWSSPELAFFALRGTSLYVTRAERPLLLNVDLHSGQLKRELQPGEKIPPAPEGEFAGGVVFPFPVDLRSEQSDLAASLRRSIREESLAGPVEVVENGPFVVCSCHEQMETSAEGRPQFHNVLRIVDQGSGRVIFAVTLNPAVTTIVPESFFVRENFLVYVKDRRTITAVRLRAETQ